MQQNPLARLIQAATNYADRTDDRNVYALEGDLRTAAMGMKSALKSDVSVNLALAAIGVVDSAKALDDIDAKLVVAWRELTPNQRERLKGTEVEVKALNAIKRVSIPECDCGNTADPNHPKRGKCKASLGGVKL